MRICVLDLELNKPSRSIIEIGAVCMDMRTGFIVSEFRTYVDPKEVIDPFITQLTDITQQDVDGEPSIEAALTSLWEFMHANNCHKDVAAWGSDWYYIFNECKKHGIQYEHPRHLDIKSMANVLRCAFPNSKSKGGLMPTLQLFGLDFIGKQHHAIDDAKNTALLLNKFKAMIHQTIKIADIMGVK